MVRSINFVQQPSEKIAIAGATGSGKTTLLKIIAGLIQPYAGEVLFEGEKIKGPLEKLLPGHPQIAYLSQNFELRNNYHVEELLQMANKLPLDDAALVYEVCRIDHLTKRKSNELSGGERQRIAFAKALVTSPKLLLLDEPFSNLDAIHRNVLKAVINDVHERLNTTCILVSHDPSDLLSWADEIIILNSGKIIQRGSPEEVYTHPVNEYAAALFGKYNSLSPELIRLFPSLQNDIRRFLRPGDFRISRDSNGVESKVERSSFLGTYYEAELNLSGYSVIVVSDHECKEGETVYLTLK